MSKVRVGFAGGTTIIDRAIQKVSGSEYCDITHAFIFLLDSIAEAEGVKEYDDIYPGFWLHPPDKYVDDEHVKIVEMDVPNLVAAQEETRRLLGTPYSYHGCLEAAAKMSGLDLPVDGEHTVMCSEAVTRILRAGGLCICPDNLADDVTPVMLYEDIMQYRGGGPV